MSGTECRTFRMQADALPLRYDTSCWQWDCLAFTVKSFGESNWECSRKVSRDPWKLTGEVTWISHFLWCSNGVRQVGKYTSLPTFNEKQVRECSKRNTYVHVFQGLRLQKHRRDRGIVHGRHWREWCCKQVEGKDIDCPTCLSWRPSSQHQVTTPLATNSTPF